MAGTVVRAPTSMPSVRFRDNLILSFKVTVLTIVINLLISVPAAYAIVRHHDPRQAAFCFRP